MDSILQETGYKSHGKSEVGVTQLFSIVVYDNKLKY